MTAGDSGLRRGTGPYPDLVRYYSQVQGWTLLRTVDRKGATVYGFQRRAEPQQEQSRGSAAFS